MKVYAFDVDETLEISGGPVTIAEVASLRNEGNIVGICGNWAVACRMPNWHLLFSFLGPMGPPKADMLVQIRTYMPAEEYVMVGNDPRVFGASADEEAARLAGWRFIREIKFAEGTR